MVDKMGTGIPIDEVATEAQKRASKAIAGKSPRDMMLKHMWFWQQRVDALTLELKTLLSGKDDRTHQKQVAKKIFKALLVARQNSQRCAVAAARYVHAKFEPIQPLDKPAITEITLKLPPLIKGEDRSYREGYEEYAPPGSKTK